MRYLVEKEGFVFVGTNNAGVEIWVNATKYAGYDELYRRLEEGMKRERSGADSTALPIRGIIGFHNGSKTQTQID